MYQQTAISCTLNNVPMTASSLQKSRLPFGIHLHPFANDDSIPESPEDLILRCGVCRAFINPYVSIGERNTWQCNLCSRLNQMPNEYIYDYRNGQYYDLRSKVELKCETVEYVATNEQYAVGPPQPATYMFVFDCSKAAANLGYIPVMAAAIADLLDEMPGDSRATVGFIAFDSNVHYFSFSGTQVVHHVSPDVSNEVAPCTTDGILANKTQKRELILDFLNQTLSTFPYEPGVTTITDTRSALGPAVKAAVKILSTIGGRIIVLQAQLPNHGGKDDYSILKLREDPSTKSNISNRNGEHISSLMRPASDYYKSLSLECCQRHISIDLFNLSTNYADLATVSQLVKFTAGTVYHYSNTSSEIKSTLIRFNQDFRNNLTRPVALEAVLRLRFSRGLKLHAFHGNCFVRSPNLIELSNINSDASFTIQMAIDNDLKQDTRFVFFQASILYTTPEGERRFRVHTARYPTVTTLPEIIYGANQTAIVAILAKMAVDRTLTESVGEAKEALILAGVDLLQIFSIIDEMRSRSYAMGLPENLRLVPLYILAFLKHIAFKINPSIKLDDRSAALERLQTLPVDDLITYIYPDLYSLHNIANDTNEDWKNPMQLTAAHIEHNGAYLLDAYDVVIIYVCEYIDPKWCYDVFGVNEYQMISEYQDVIIEQPSASNTMRPRDPAHFTGSYASLPPKHSSSLSGNNSDGLKEEESVESELVKLPEFDNFTSIQLREFINCLIDAKPHKPKFYILKDKSKARFLFTQYFIDDRSENYYSYAEFWKFLQDQASRC